MSAGATLSQYRVSGGGELARSRKKQVLEPEGASSLEGAVSPLSTSSAELPVALIPAERTEQDYRNISEQLLHVAGKVPVLSSLAWSREVKERFLAAKGTELPRVEYPDRRAEFREAEARALSAAASFEGDDPVLRWARATCESYAQAARMLASIGTPAFTRNAEALYGGARTRFLDGETTNLDLARHLLKTVDDLGVPDTDEEDQLDSRRAARLLKRRLREEFPGEEIRVVISPNLASKAIAGTRRIRLRKDARYSRHEIDLLLVHEGLVHIATTLNGLHQPLLRCLGKGSPRTMGLQEGLAVFAEFMAGVVDLRRLRRLADRVVAIDMAAQGADFLEVYRYFTERGRDAEEAFESTRRVFRGGLLTGGAPFTKDVVYLYGAAQVRNFFAVALEEGTLDDVPRLFVGKIALEDLEALRAMAAGGWISPPRYMPRWAHDRGLLAASLSFGMFFRQIDLDSLREHYAPLYDGS